MKIIGTQLSYLLRKGQSRRNMRALLKLFLLLLGVMMVYTVLFRVVMAYAEGQQHSWLTGFYWTLTVMSTLGFGDITFHTDIGRLFSILVLISGIVLLLIVMPFAFIQFFYAPWLDAQTRAVAPRAAPKDMSDHVVICRYDEMMQTLIRALRRLAIKFVVIEPDPRAAADLHSEGISVVAADVDAADTFRAVRAAQARLVIANLSDALNTNIAITVHEEVAPETPIAAIAEQDESIDILELSGASAVVPLKRRLGEQLANRVPARTREAHVVGAFEDLVLAELAVRGTHLAGLTVAESGLRESTGVHVVGAWVRGKLLPSTASTLLSDHVVIVVLGTEEQLSALNAQLASELPSSAPVLVIGAGKVGRAAVDVLHSRGVAVNVVEKSEAACAAVRTRADRVVCGDAADRDVIMRAGLDSAASVILTTNEDAINIYLTVYCRKLAPRLRIVSRLGHERNLEAMNRAGADFVLSYTAVGAKSLLAVIQDRPALILAEGVDLFVEAVPKKLAGLTLETSEIRGRSGLTVVAIRGEDGALDNPPATARLATVQELVMLGTAAQREQFVRRFGA